MSRRKAVVAVLLGICLSAWPAQAQQTSNQIWPELDAFVKLGENERLYFLASGERIAGEGSSGASLGVHLDIFTSPLFKKRLERTAKRADVARNKFLQVRIGYLYDPISSEQTPTIEGSPRYYFPKGILITNRTRADFRFPNGDFTPRFRERMKLERSFTFGQRIITPYAHAEAFYDWRYNAWHRFRYTGGMECELSRKVVLEGYYVRQKDTRSATKYVNALGITLQIYFR